EVVEQDGTGVTYRKRLPEHGLEVVKRYRVDEVPEEFLENPDYPGYGLTLDVEVRNLSDQGVDVAYRLDGSNGLPLEGWWYAHRIGRSWSAGGLRDVVGRYFGGETADQSPTDIANGDATDF